MERMATKFGSAVVSRLGLKRINGQPFSAPWKISQPPTSSNGNSYRSYKSYHTSTTTLDHNHNNRYTLNHQFNKQFSTIAKMPEYAKNQPAGFKNAVERVAIVGVGVSLRQHHIHRD
jgi:hypothetical protein